MLNGIGFTPTADCQKEIKPSERCIPLSRHRSTPPWLQTGNFLLYPINDRYNVTLWAKVSSTLFVPLQHCSISPSSALLSKKIVINRSWSKDLIGIFYLITKCHKCWASAYQDQSCRSHFSNTTSPNHTTMWGLNISQMLSNIFLSISLFTGEVKAPSSLCVPSDSSTESWEFHIPASSHITHSSSGCRASGTAPAQNGLGNSPQASKPLQSFKQVFSGTFYITVTPTGCRILLALVVHNPSGALVWF